MTFMDVPAAAWSWVEWVEGFCFVVAVVSVLTLCIVKQAGAWRDKNEN